MIWTRLGASVLPHTHSFSIRGDATRLLQTQLRPAILTGQRSNMGLWTGSTDEAGSPRARYPGIVLSAPALWVYMFDCFQGWIPWDLLCECPETPKANLTPGLCMFFRSTDDQNWRYTSRGLIGWHDLFWWLVYVYFYIFVCSST